MICLSMMRNYLLHLRTLSLLIKSNLKREITDWVMQKDLLGQMVFMYCYQLIYLNLGDILWTTFTGS